MDDTDGASPKNDSRLPTPQTSALLGDPFLGPCSDFGEEMNWEDLDSWVQAFQADDLCQHGNTDYQATNVAGPLSWW